MTITRMVVLLGLLVLPFGGNVHAEYFEGILHMEINTKGKPGLSRIFIRGSQIRLESISPMEPGSVFIINTQKKSYVYLNPSEKTAYQDSFEAFREILAKKQEVTKGSYRKTGDRSTIAEYQTEQVIHNHHDGRMAEWWITTTVLLDPQVSRGLRELLWRTSHRQQLFRL